MSFAHTLSNLDLDSLCQDLGLELIEERGSELRFRCADWDGHHQHGDRNGKLYINRDKLLYQCWVAGGGDIIQLVSNIKSISRDDALEYVKRFGNDSIPLDVFVQELEGLFDEKEKPASVVYPYFNIQVLKKWERSHPWFKERNISDTIRQQYHCGYREDTDSIILPHFFNERLVGWQSRHLSSLPKYQNSNKLPKKTTLWNYDNAKISYKIPIVVESVTTALMLISRGYNSIATFGAQITLEQTKLLRVFGDGIIISTDNDVGGEVWEDRIIRDLGQYIPIWRLGLVEGKKSDLGDYKGDLDKFIEERELILT